MVDFTASLMSKSREIAQIHQKTEIENRTKIKNVISTMDGYLFGLPINACKMQNVHQNAGKMLAAPGANYSQGHLLRAAITHV